MNNQVSQEAAFQLIGQQALELMVLRQRLAEMLQHRCPEPKQQCCASDEELAETVEHE